MRALFPVGRHLSRTLWQVFAFINIERGERRRAGHRVSAIGIAVVQIDIGRWSLHECGMDIAMHEYRAHRNRAVGDALRHRHQIGRHAKLLAREP